MTLAGPRLLPSASVLGPAEDFVLTSEATEVGADRADMALTVTCVAGEPVEAGVRVELVLGATANPGWLIPGLFYGENRFAECTRLYPRWTPDRGDPARMESDAWSFRADRAATPAVFGWDGTGGAALVTTETSALGESGLGLATVDGRPALRLHFPYREEPVTYHGSPVPSPADLPRYRWAPGERVTVRYSVHRLGPDRHGYARVLRAVHAETPALPEEAAWVSIVDAADLAAWGLYRWHYRPDPPVLLETAAFDRDAFGDRADRRAMHVSWVSGTPYAYALLRHGRRVGRADYVDAATGVLDHIADNLAPSGMFWGQWTPAGWDTGWTGSPRKLHSRTVADAALFLLRATVHEGRSGWAGAVRSTVDVALAGQRADGAFPAGYDAVDGSPVGWVGTAGLAWVPVLVEGAAHLGEPAWLTAAIRAGRHYLSDVDAEFLCGAPEDVDLAPTSEDGYVAVMAYLLLHEADPEGGWLDVARRAAEWTLTFRYTYDVAFAPHTLLGAYRFRTRGADQASPANQHLHAFGLICHPELERLARHLDDSYLLASARENLACFRQFVAREDGDFNAYRGMVSERYYQTDCFQAKGMLLTLSHAWSAGVLLHACEAALAGDEPGRR
jgi:hypothetical protein